MSQVSDIAKAAFEEIKHFSDFKELTQEESKLIEDTMRSIQDLTTALPILPKEERERILETDLKMAKDTLLDVGAAKGLRVGKKAMGVLSKALINSVKIGLTVL